jgi:hypothetical protein
MFKPWFQGRGMIGAICGMVDIIGYVKIEEVKNEPHQVMYSRTRGRYYARDRYMALPAAMVDPTIPKIEALVKAKVQGSNRTSNTTTKRPAKRTAKRAATR